MLLVVCEAGIKNKFHKCYLCSVYVSAASNVQGLRTDVTYLLCREKLMTGLMKRILAVTSEGYFCCTYKSCGSVYYWPAGQELRSAMTYLDGVLWRDWLMRGL